MALKIKIGFFQMKQIGITAGTGNNKILKLKM